MVEDCIFCKIVAGQIPAQIIDQDEQTLSFMDIAPATRGHALVIPKLHAADLLEIEPDQLAAVASSAQRLALHVHVIPRYAGDPLKLPWVPTAGEMDVIAATAAKLR